MSVSVIGGFEIIGIRDAGNLQEERLLLKAIEPSKLEYYVVINAKVTGDKLDVLNDKIFWFPVILVNPGEYVRLYSKRGQYKKEDSTYGSTPAVYHNFYWQSETCIWNAEKSNAFTIFKINTWATAYPEKKSLKF